MQRQLETLGAQRAGLEDMLKEMKRKVRLISSDSGPWSLLYFGRIWENQHNYDTWGCTNLTFLHSIVLFFPVFCSLVFWLASLFVYITWMVSGWCLAKADDIHWVLWRSFQERDSKIWSHPWRHCTKYWSARTVVVANSGIILYSVLFWSCFLVSLWDQDACFYLSWCS